jgi:rhodanese-related sulfurtransferase
MHAYYIQKIFFQGFHIFKKIKFQMKKLVFLLLVGLSVSAFKLIQNKEFACLPCGSECDGKTYNAAGKCSGCGMDLVEKSTIHFSNISIAQLCDRISANPKAILLDVRSVGEFKGTTTEVPTIGHFKNAININVAELERRVNELKKDKESEILVYCSHAHRSAVASYFLSTHGFKNVKNMLGGVSTIDQQASECLKKSFVAHTR